MTAIYSEIKAFSTLDLTISILEFLDISERHVQCTQTSRIFAEAAQFFATHDRRLLAEAYRSGDIDLVAALGGPLRILSLPRLPTLTWEVANGGIGGVGEAMNDDWNRFAPSIKRMQDARISLARINEVAVFKRIPCNSHAFMYRRDYIIARIRDLSIRGISLCVNETWHKGKGCIEAKCYLNGLGIVLFSKDVLECYLQTDGGNYYRFSDRWRCKILTQHVDYLTRLVLRLNCGSLRQTWRGDSVLEEKGPVTTVVGGFLGFCERSISRVALVDDSKK